MTTIPYLSAEDVFALLPPADAVGAIEAALRAGLDPAAGVPRASVSLAHGSMLLMPAESAAHAGVKLVTVAPGNAERGLPRINALYTLFDAETLRPAAIVDGTALTTLRTPAVSFAAVRRFLPPAPRLVVFGAGPQGSGHIATLSALVTPASVTVITRSGSSAVAGTPGTAAEPRAAAADMPEAIARRATNAGTSEAPTAPSAPITGLAEAADAPRAAITGTPEAPAAPMAAIAGTAEAAAALRAADVVVCATTAREALFDSALLGDRAIVIAVGSHEPDAREVDTAFCRRATVVVEDRATALREAGDVIQAGLGAADLITIADVVRGVAVPAGPILFKGTGMSWEDLVVAEAVLDRFRGKDI